MGKVIKPAGWNDKGLKSINRPEVLESKNTKVDLLKQSSLIGQIKKGKADMKELPEGVVRSIENKAKIIEAISMDKVDVDSIRERLNIGAKPLNLKNAREHREELEARFEKNRTKNNSKGTKSLDNLKGRKTSQVNNADKVAEKMATSRKVAVKKTSKPVENKSTSKKASVDKKPAIAKKAPAKKTAKK